MIMARNGRYLAITGHDHETAPAASATRCHCLVDRSLLSIKARAPGQFRRQVRLDPLHRLDRGLLLPGCPADQGASHRRPPEPPRGPLPRAGVPAKSSPRPALFHPRLPGYDAGCHDAGDSGGNAAGYQSRSRSALTPRARSAICAQKCLRLARGIVCHGADRPLNSVC
jgi:hypothetical protein